jgi:hypothetical protein
MGAYFASDEKNPAPVWHGIKSPIVAMGQGGSNIVSGGR